MKLTKRQMEVLGDIYEGTQTGMEMMEKVKERAV